MESQFLLLAGQPESIHAGRIQNYLSADGLLSGGCDDCGLSHMKNDIIKGNNPDFFSVLTGITNDRELPGVQGSGILYSNKAERADDQIEPIIFQTFAKEEQPSCIKEDDISPDCQTDCQKPELSDSPNLLPAQTLVSQTSGTLSFGIQASEERTSDSLVLGERTPDSQISSEYLSLKSNPGLKTSDSENILLSTTESGLKKPELSDSPNLLPAQTLESQTSEILSFEIQASEGQTSDSLILGVQTPETQISSEYLSLKSNPGLKTSDSENILLSTTESGLGKEKNQDKAELLNHTAKNMASIKNSLKTESIETGLKDFVDPSKVNPDKNFQSNMNTTTEKTDKLYTDFPENITNRRLDSKSERNLFGNKENSGEKKIDARLISNKIFEIKPEAKSEIKLDIKPDIKPDGKDSLTFFSTDRSFDNISESVLNSKETQPFNKSMQTQIITQLVEKASLKLKNGKTEIKIDLKPEFLGRVRMQISMSNQQVMVKILTQLPVVRDMIENNINLLKVDLQDHGLEIDKFDVFVFDDPDQNRGEHKNTAFLKAGYGSRNDNETEDMPLAEIKEISMAEKGLGESLIGIFA